MIEQKRFSPARVELKIKRIEIRYITKRGEEPHSDRDATNAICSTGIIESCSLTLTFDTSLLHPDL